jgi:hypothetical protein
MNNHDDWLRSILTKIDERQDKQAELLATLNALMSEHMRRTDELEKDMKPVKEHVSFVNRAGKLLITTGGLLGALHSIGLF